MVFGGKIIIFSCVLECKRQRKTWGKKEKKTGLFSSFKKVLHILNNLLLGKGLLLKPCCVKAKVLIEKSMDWASTVSSEGFITADCSQMHSHVMLEGLQRDLQPWALFSFGCRAGWEQQCPAALDRDLGSGRGWCRCARMSCKHMASGAKWAASCVAATGAGA